MNCAHVANSVENVIGFLKRIPQPKPIENCYPYAWAWKELGLDAQIYQAKLRENLLLRMTNVFHSRFPLINNVN